VWRRYVACKDMAAKAAAAVRDGQMKIVPEAFNATVRCGGVQRPQQHQGSR
jgi:hypothetical protein